MELRSDDEIDADVDALFDEIEEMKKNGVKEDDPQILAKREQVREIQE
ncbi:MAG: hypothetical protein H6767_09935 [Candidatus Peribacteria bacterium]|nr:MAG: hypothetical protein H6767_09935 [Candidatus Peribacteria bacterium]